MLRVSALQEAGDPEEAAALQAALLELCRVFVLHSVSVTSDENSLTKVMKDVGRRCKHCLCFYCPEITTIKSSTHTSLSYFPIAGIKHRHQRNI